MGVRHRFAGELDRRPWYQLEDRHTGVAAGRLGAAAVVALVALLAASRVQGLDRAQALAVTAAAVVVHAALWIAPRRWPRRLRLAVDLSLIVDAAWASALAHAAGGPYGPLAGAFIVTALWAALGYSARTGVKAGVCASLGFLFLVWYADGGRLWSVASLGRLAFFWGVLAAAIAGRRRASVSCASAPSGWRCCTGPPASCWPPPIERRWSPPRGRRAGSCCPAGRSRCAWAPPPTSCG